MKIKPKVYSMGSCGHEIIYRCGKKDCDMCFNLANDDWHFCPHCGTKIDWGVVTRANEEWKQLFLSTRNDKLKHNVLLEELDKLNSNITDNCRRAMITTEATKKAIRKSNAQYYLGIGWTKKELIDKGWFINEDFE